MSETRIDPEEALRRQVEDLERTLHLQQLQINRLLDITRAINNNVKFADLFRMYQDFLGWEMGVTRMVLFVRDKDDNGWTFPVHIGLTASFVESHASVADQFPRFTRMAKLDQPGHPFLKEFDLVIPVMHKEVPIAYAFLGQTEEDTALFQRIQFITTITNVVAVALENKRLFKRQVEQEGLKREMALASDIQRMLVPEHLPRGGHFEVASIYRPQQGVGGDYYDFLVHEDGRASLCVADISGKGLSAAMMMSNFQANLHALLIQGLDIAELMRRLNAVLYRLTQGARFITLFYAEYDPADRVLRYVNAGHVPPLLVRDGRLSRLTEGCTLLGGFPELPSLSVGKERLSPGSLVLNYTDGLTDLRNERGEFPGEQQLPGFVLERHSLPPEELNRQLLAWMDGFRGEQAVPDDITVLTCLFK